MDFNIKFGNGSCRNSVLSVIFFALPVASWSALAGETVNYRWQIDKLMQPSESQIQREKESQSVFIYEQLMTADVDRALEDQFERVEHMMFVKTMLPPTDKGGEPIQQPDGCE